MATLPHFEIEPASNGEWRWRFRAVGNAEIMASGEGYRASATASTPWAF